MTLTFQRLFVMAVCVSELLLASCSSVPCREDCGAQVSASPSLCSDVADCAQGGAGVVATDVRELGEFPTESAYRGGNADLDGHQVNLLGCLMPTWIKDSEKSWFLLVPCDELTIDGFARAPLVPMSHRLVVVVDLPGVKFERGSRMLVSGTYKLSRVADGKILYGWARLQNCTIRRLKDRKGPCGSTESGDLSANMLFEELTVTPTGGR